MDQRVPDQDQDSATFSDEFMLFSNNLHPGNWDCVDCPPPEFHLPPPPRPPWLDQDDPDEGKDCDSQTRLVDFLSDLDSCDSDLVINVNDGQTQFEDTFHSIAVIVVSAVVLVIFLLILGVFIFK